MTAIQPCALLLLVSPDWQVEAVSANVAMLGDNRPSAVAGQPLGDLIGSKAIHNLRNRLAWLASDESEVQDFGVEWGDVNFDIRATREEDWHLVEAELAVEPRLPDGIGIVRSMSDRLTGKSPAAMADQAVRQIAALTGFEQITLSDRQGEAIACNRNDAPKALLQSVDTPRLIADCASEPVPIIGGDEYGLIARAAYLAPDTARCDQLQAAGMAASMALPLRIDGEQVATLHGHHPSARRIGAERRSVVHLFAERLVARMARQGWQS